VTALPSPASRSPWALYTIFFVSGCAGLVYEVMWTRSFGLVFGSSTRAAALVLAAFFLGMALGNWAGARFAAVTRAQALRRYAWLELAVAVSALAVLGWLALYHTGYPRVYQATFEAPRILSLLQLGLAALALAPPCIGMGATLPLMSRAVVTSEAHLGRRLGFVYALNTVGGVAGVILSGFWLPVALGVRGSMFLAAALNVVAALAAFAAARGLDDFAVTPPASAPRVAEPRSVWLPLAFVAVASGLGTLALEVLFTRLLVNAIDSSVFSFALVLATFLVSLALGSALVSALVDRLRSPWTLIGVGAWLGAVGVLLAPKLCTLVWIRTDEEPWLRGPLGAATVLLPAAFLVIGPAAVSIGMVLPAAWRAAIRRVESTGALVGRLTSLNTFAGVAGSLTMGFLLIPTLGVGYSTLGVAGLYAALGLHAALRGGTSRAMQGLALAGAIACTTLVVLGSWRIVPVILPSGYRLLAVDEGEGATISITESRNRVRYLNVNSRYTLGSSNGIESHRSQGELAFALHGAPRDVAFIGVATGLSVSSILSVPSVERVVAMELLPGVLRLAQAFREENRGVLEDPRVELRLADGRNHLFGSAQRFDAIVGDLFVPWHAGTGYLYSVEHFASVHDRLREGGVFVQWLQQDQISLLELKSVARSFTTAFAEAELWLNATQRARPMLGFVGYRGRARPADPHAQVGKMSRVCREDLLREWSAEAPLNTDDFPFIEFSAAASHLGPMAEKARQVAAAIDWLRAEERKRWLDGEAAKETSRRPPSE
jgi:spermidine synthase